MLGLKPYLNCNFFVEIRGILVGGFTQVSGLGGEIEIEEFREGGMNSHTRKLPGPAKYPANITLRHGVTEFDTLWRWYHDAAHGDIRRHNGSIIMLRRGGVEYLRWNFIQAFPVRWEGPELDAMNAAVAISTFEIAHNGIHRMMI